MNLVLAPGYAPEFLQDTPLAITVVLLFLLNLLLLPGLAFLALLGVLRLSKAMAGQCYRYLLLGPTED